MYGLLVLFLLVTFYVPVLYVTTQAVVSLFVVRDSGDSTSQTVPFFCFVLRYDSLEFGFRNLFEY